MRRDGVKYLKSQRPRHAYTYRTPERDTDRLVFESEKNPYSSPDEFCVDPEISGVTRPLGLSILCIGLGTLGVVTVSLLAAWVLKTPNVIQNIRFKNAIFILSLTGFASLRIVAAPALWQGKAWGWWLIGLMSAEEAVMNAWYLISPLFLDERLAEWMKQVMGHKPLVQRGIFMALQIGICSYLLRPPVVRYVGFPLERRMYYLGAFTIGGVLIWCAYAGGVLILVWCRS